MNENEIFNIIRGAIYKTHNDLGPGLSESVYEAVLAYNLAKVGMMVESQVALPVIFDEVKNSVKILH